MIRGTLQMISFMALLLLTNRTVGWYQEQRTPGLDTRAPRCISWKQVQERWERLQKRYNLTSSMEHTHACDRSHPITSTKCEQRIKEMRENPRNFQEKNQRSLSPWEYSSDQDENRFPRVISMARCLCDGCIIKGEENQSYNSVPVCSKMMVLWRKACPTDPTRYVVRKGFISVSVGCTCVRPKN